MQATFSSYDVCDLAGCSYRQLDYWVRTDVLEPLGASMPGSGYTRRFGAHEVSVATAITRLAGIGGPRGGLLRHVAAMLRAMPREEWTGHLAILPSGAVARLAAAQLPPVCWLLDLDACVTPSMVAA